MSVLAVIARDLIGLAGAASITYGAWLVLPAAGFIVGGAFALVGAIVLAKASADDPSDVNEDAA
jgi:hypothetical protein